MVKFTQRDRVVNIARPIIPPVVPDDRRPNRRCSSRGQCGNDRCPRRRYSPFQLQFESETTVVGFGIAVRGARSRPSTADRPSSPDSGRPPSIDRRLGLVHMFSAERRVRRAHIDETTAPVKRCTATIAAADRRMNVGSAAAAGQPCSAVRMPELARRAPPSQSYSGRLYIGASNDDNYSSVGRKRRPKRAIELSAAETARRWRRSSR